VPSSSEKSSHSEKPLLLPLPVLADHLPLQEGAIKLEIDHLNDGIDEEEELTLMEELTELQAWVEHCVRAGMGRLQVMGGEGRKRGVIQLV
jgi:hypothetical protein